MRFARLATAAVVSGSRQLATPTTKLETRGNFEQSVIESDKTKPSNFQLEAQRSELSVDNKFPRPGRSLIGRDVDARPSQEGCNLRASDQELSADNFAIPSPDQLRDRKSLTVRFVTLLRRTVASVTIHRPKCDFRPFLTVLFVTDHLPFCDHLCSLRPSR